MYVEEAGACETGREHENETGREHESETKVTFLRVYFIYLFIFKCSFLSPCVKENVSLLCFVYWKIYLND